MAVERTPWLICVLLLFCAPSKQGKDNISIHTHAFTLNHFESASARSKGGCRWALGSGLWAHVHLAGQYSRYWTVLSHTVLFGEALCIWCMCPVQELQHIACKKINKKRAASELPNRNWSASFWLCTMDSITSVFYFGIQSCDILDLAGSG